MLTKGILVSALSVEISKQIAYVQKEDFIDDIMGIKRPLLTIEVTHIYTNIITNFVGKALLMGFGQVTNSKVKI